ncbi:MAG: hypothetical protein JWR61_2994 [Ferruginibacter sp.]|nr:hypothetical protein [Ferruginibacter sp.]
MGNYFQQHRYIYFRRTRLIAAYGSGAVPTMLQIEISTTAMAIGKAQSQLGGFAWRPGAEGIFSPQ